MRILALDTATGACSVALWRDGQVLGHRLEIMERGHSEALMPMVQEVMAGTAYDALDLLAVTIGPGAFTGLRIGLAAARGMALAAGVPCVGVTTLEAVAHGVPESERSHSVVLAALESKRADVFVQVFDSSLAPLTEPRAVAPDAVASLLPPTPASVVVVGDGRARVLPALVSTPAPAQAPTGRGAVASAAPTVPDAATVAAIAAARWRAGDRPSAAPSPLYLRPPDAIPAKNGGRLRP